MTAESVINQFTYVEYGQFIIVDPPTFDHKSQTYYSNIRSDFPVFIHDDREPADYKVRVLKIESLGQIYLNKDLQIIPQLTTRSEECNTNLESLLRLWRDQAERIVLSCSSDNLATIEEFRHHLNQIELIIDNLKEYGEIRNFEINKFMPSYDRIKLKRYLSLLKGLDIVREVESGYKPGERFISIENVAKNENAFRNSILSYIIKNRYQTLRDVFKITILERTVNIDNIIYLPELELEEPIHRMKQSIASSYKFHYKQNINPLHLTHILSRLKRCKAIRQKGNRYFGCNDLREDMLKVKRTLRPLTIDAFK
jgi:hypothetical protein